MQVARTSRLSVGCCSLPFAASVVPHRHRCWLHGPEQSVSRNVLPNRWTALHLPHLRRAGNRADPTCFRATCCQVTSWQGESSSLEIVGCPSSGRPTCVHSTRARARDRTTAWWPWFSFRPCGLSPLRRFSPHLGSEPIAARCRTWGSLGFWGARRCRPKTTRTRSAFPPALHPPKVYSSSVAVPHRWGLLPPDRSSRNGVATARRTNPRRRCRVAPSRVAELKSLSDA